MVRRWIAGVALTALCMACGAEAQQSALDTPEAHYRQGLRELEKGDTAGASEAFGRAQKLNPGYAGAYVGLALVALEQGKAAQAEEYLKAARKKDKKFMDIYIVEGRLLSRLRPGDDWLKKAMEQFEKAAKLDPRNDKTFYYQGETYKDALMLQEAETAYGKAVGLKGDLQEAASARLSLVQDIRRAAPGTNAGVRIGLVPVLHRGELTVLLMDELKLKDLIARRRPKAPDTSFQGYGATGATSPPASRPAPPPDIAGHWAKGWVEDVLSLEVAGLGLYPDGRFGPDDPVTRATFAQVAQGILLLVTGDQGLATKYVGETSRFADVRPDAYYYNAAALCVDRGFLRSDKISGQFRPETPVSGAEALLAIKDLKEGLAPR